MGFWSINMADGESSTADTQWRDSSPSIILMVLEDTCPMNNSSVCLTTSQPVFPLRGSPAPWVMARWSLLVLEEGMLEPRNINYLKRQVRHSSPTQHWRGNQKFSDQDQQWLMFACTDFCKTRKSREKVQLTQARKSLARRELKFSTPNDDLVCSTQISPNLCCGGSQLKLIFPQTDAQNGTSWKCPADCIPLVTYIPSHTKIIKSACWHSYSYNIPDSEAFPRLSRKWMVLPTPPSMNI